MSAILLFVLKFFGFNVFSTVATVLLIVETIAIPVYYFLSLSIEPDGKGHVRFDALPTKVTLLLQLILITAKIIVLIVFFKTGFNITATFILFMVLSILDTAVLICSGAFHIIFPIFAILNIVIFIVHLVWV